MKPLNKIQSLIQQIGGILLLVGAVLPLHAPFSPYAPYVLTSGAVLFGTMQLMNKYEGKDITVKRLRRQQLLGALLLVAAGVLMLCSLYRIGPCQQDEWLAALAIGTVLEVYTSFRLPAALKKAQHKR